MKDCLIGLASVMVSTRSYQQSEEYLRRATEMLGDAPLALEKVTKENRAMRAAKECEVNCIRV